PLQEGFIGSPWSHIGSRSMIRRWMWILMFTGFMTIVHSQIAISNIRAQIPCNRTRLLCGGRQEQALSFDVEFNVPVTSLLSHAEKWMVVPFSLLDSGPGFQFCDQSGNGFNQCFLVNNGSGVDVSVEIGSFRLAYQMEAPNLHTDIHSGSIVHQEALIESVPGLITELESWTRVQ